MLALPNMKVLDISQIMAGPYCTMVLADLGAEVTKVEKINGGDDSRQMGPYVNEESTCFAQINRNKKSISINLKEEQGKELFYQLARDADVIVENYRPGVTKSLKIDYETLKDINPGIIYCSISGYGQTGPYSHKGGFDLVAQGMTGLMSMTGEPGRRPLKTGIAVYDIGAGITAVYSILAAYIHKMNTGEGQLVDVAIAECGLPWFSWEAAAYFSEGTVPQPTGWRHRVSAPYQALQARDGYFMLGCANQRTWERLCQEVIMRPDLLEDPRFTTNYHRGQNVEALEAVLEEIFTNDDMHVWLARCDQAGVPAGPINNFAQAVQDPHYQERGMVQEVEHPVIGKMKMVGFPSKLSLTPPSIRQPAPVYAQHTDEVLQGLGLSAERLAVLREQGVIK
ncbi:MULTISPECIES: CoA transferase [Chromohalobacter]|jgi:formyl-CoA transferase|uniref:L-carnitine dehydratase/bile acid-inducible protein F n=1 Tax=Chromohalobacter israelensis (strain ATCC BAA-138 / DSM 3043 / CIP 106854 / NCIMB 13768 / 1H11) TaxID=290398 RepID=Q1QSM7_CHRI1|nr:MULTISPECIES: CoA transferase [Chromohalobacter]ABE60531.1 L-carnitine dehydratase/bile acid-inducible protein F [Chromohalobacter salexigens DSM 3043]NQY46471.1 CoA transferase [Chromohalobacter sp.]